MVCALNDCCNVGLNHILTYVREGKFKGLTNDLLFKLGAEIELYPGLPEFFDKLKQSVKDNQEYAKHSIAVEHYIVSTGLAKMIEGSRIAPFVDGIWGCEFVDGTANPDYLEPGQPDLFAATTPGPITNVAYAIDNTTKTRALFEINKGCNKEARIDVNATLALQDRRVPFEHMIYIADGPSDVPAFSIVNHHGGKTFAVYKAGKRDQFNQAAKLQQEKRVQGIGEANYMDDSLTAYWISEAVDQIAATIIASRQRVLGERVGSAPQHILTDIPDLLPKKPSASAVIAPTVSDAPVAAIQGAKVG